MNKSRSNLYLALAASAACIGLLCAFTSPVVPGSGYSIGRTVNDRVGFHGSVVTQRSGAAQDALTDNTGGSVSDATLADGLTVTSVTDSSGGAAANGTIEAVTAPTSLTDNGGGTADGTVASQAAPVTLTDSTGFDGTHDDTLAAVTVMADLTGTEDPTEAEFNTLLATVRIIAQNQSDTAQKVIELVTLAGNAQNNLKELTTRQAENRTAIVALTDAIKELSTKINTSATDLGTQNDNDAKVAELVNEIRAALVAKGLIKGSS